MKKIAIIERLENNGKKKPFNIVYYLDSSYRKIFDKLDVILIPVISERNIEEISNICDGLILTGSANDVHPKYYNEEPIKDKKYDKFDEYPLVKKCVEEFNKQNKPILGICAGIQELNVIFGGTLFQSIPNHNLKDQSKHIINIEEDSFLYKIYKKDKLQVNSYHEQAIKDVAPGFRIVARCDDGTIEGIEKDNVIGVQWHPESVLDMEIFEGFVTKKLQLSIGMISSTEK